MVKTLMQYVTAVLCMVASAGHAAVVLQYHHVSDEMPASTSVSVQQFAEHLQHLADEGFDVVALDVLLERVREGLDPREKVAAITFDDGFKDVFDNALPLLDRRGWKAAMFVTPSRVGQGLMLTAAQLRSMDQRGHLVLNHGWNHDHMIRREDGESQYDWRRRMKGQVERAQTALQEWVGHALPKLFAYPYGEQDAALREVLSGMGYVAFGQHTGALSKEGDWQNLPRISVSRHYAVWVPATGASLRDKVLALPMPVSALSPSSAVTTLSTGALSFTLPSAWRERMLNCFAAGAMLEPKMEAQGDEVRVTLEAAIPVGRSRFTCTASAGDDRYYWFSWMWMRKPERGWYAE